MVVVHLRAEEEVVVAATVEEVLLPRRRRRNLADSRDDDSSDSSDEVPQNVISDENSVYFDERKVVTVTLSEIDNHEEIAKIMNDVASNTNLESSKAKISTVSAGENVIVEESDDIEEVVELEFERAVDKLHTHTPHCPNCDRTITRVILRRKIRARPRVEEPGELFGCLSCFRIFKLSGGGRLNQLGLFKSKSNEQPSLSAGGTTINAEDQHPPISVGVTTVNAGGTWPRLNPFDCFGYSSTTTEAAGVAKTNKRLHTSIQIDPGVTEEMPDLRQPLISGNQRSKSLEILKCIVYGGLIESIASLSVISSAAASDATTLNVVVIGLATLLSSLIAFGCNLVELRNNITKEKYLEVLGVSEHFLFHSTFAILSYLLFGLVAPTTYAFAFRESDNKDYKMLAVAAAGLGCIFILAIAKAYVKGINRFGGYIKTILYYVTIAVSASGIAYATGDLIGMLLDDLGWFQPAQHVAPRVSMWASY